MQPAVFPRKSHLHWNFKTEDAYDAGDIALSEKKAKILDHTKNLISCLLGLLMPKWCNTRLVTIVYKMSCVLLDSFRSFEQIISNSQNCNIESVYLFLSFTITFALAKEIRASVIHTCKKNPEAIIKSVSQKAINNSSMGHPANSLI